LLCPVMQYRRFAVGGGDPGLTAPSLRHPWLSPLAVLFAGGIALVSLAHPADALFSVDLGMVDRARLDEHPVSTRVRLFTSTRVRLFTPYNAPESIYIYQLT
jgi:hypothetical protein